MNGAGKKLAACLAVWCFTGSAPAGGGTQRHLQLPMSAREEAAQVAGVGARSGAVFQGLGAVDAERQHRYLQRDYSQRWEEASGYERTLLIEKVGEQGGKRLVLETQSVLGPAEQRLGFGGRSISQGPDRGYWIPRTGKYLVVESKGGASRLKVSFRARQGTNLNALKSAEAALGKLAAASGEEAIELALVIKAAQQDRLATGVSRTPHELGTPMDPKWDGSLDRTSVAREAKEIELKQRARDPKLGEIYDKAGRILRRKAWKYRMEQSFAVLEFAASVALAWEAYHDWSLAAKEWTSPTGESLRVVALTGRAVARTGESATLAARSSAALARSLGYTGKLVKFGDAAGKIFLPLAFFVEGFNAGIAYNDFSTGRISQRDWYRGSTGPWIFASFTATGAIFGGFLGSPFAVVGAVPGAIAGAEIGALVSLPASFAADWWWEYYYSSFDAEMQSAVRKSIVDLYR